VRIFIERYIANPKGGAKKREHGASVHRARACICNFSHGCRLIEVFSNRGVAR